MRAENRQKNKNRKWLRITGITLLVLLVIGGGYAFYLYHQLAETVETMQGDYDREVSEKRGKKVNLNNKEPFSALIMGVDAREGDRGRSDTMIVLTVNPKQKSVKMVSIPRDTRTLLVGRGTQDKINHSYAFGGTSMAVNTVENFLNIPVDYYIKMNMEGFQDIVNAVGGITVNNPFAFTQDGISFPKGRIDLNGAEALAYSRMRKQDPSGDYGRQSRQRQVIQGVISKGANPLIVTRMDTILGAIGANAQTNMTFDEMKIVQRKYSEARHNIDQIQIQGTGSNIGGVYYLIVSDQTRNSVSSELRTHLEL